MRFILIIAAVFFILSCSNPQKVEQDISNGEYSNNEYSNNEYSNNEYSNNEYSNEEYQTSADILIEDIHFYIKHLTSDYFEGRGSGSVGEMRAGNFIQKKFKELGLQPANDSNSYFQEFTFKERSTLQNVELIFDNFSCVFNRDFSVLVKTDKVEVSGKVLFIDNEWFSEGGIKIENNKNINFKDKWILLFEKQNDSDFKNELFYSSTRVGALGILSISQEDDFGYLPDWHMVFSSVGIPIIEISSRVADRLFNSIGFNKKMALKKVSETKNPLKIPVKVRIKGMDKTTKSNNISSRNVIGYLEGNDPVLKKEIIVVGANYDNLGMKILPTAQGNDTVIFRGADNNASGVAGLLELAEKFAASKNRLKRSILFVAFGAEKRGVRGSSHFCTNFFVPTFDIRLMIDMDKVGCMDTMNNTFFNTIVPNVWLNNLLKKIKIPSDSLNLNIKDIDDGSSSYFPFYYDGVDVVTVTTGSRKQHDTYMDKIETINFPGEKRILDFIYKLIKAKVEEN